MTRPTASVARTSESRDVAARASGSAPFPTCHASGASEAARIATTLLSGAETAKGMELKTAVSTPARTQPISMLASPIP